MSNPSPGALAQLFELVGSRGLRLVADKALGPGLFTELPPADEAYRTLTGTGSANATVSVFLDVRG